MRALRYAAAWCVCAMALAMAGCAGNLYTRTYKTLTVAENIDAAAAAAFPNLDRAKRASIVASATSEADGIAKLAAWDAVADKLVLAIKGTSASVKLVRDALADISAGRRPPREMSGWMASALGLGIDLGNLLRAAGVPFTVAL